MLTGLPYARCVRLSARARRPLLMRARWIDGTRERKPAAADAVDGGVGDPQAHARPLGRGVMRALGREPVLPAVQLRARRSAHRHWKERAVSSFSSRPSHDGWK